MKQKALLIVIFFSAWKLSAQVIGISIDPDPHKMSFKTGNELLSSMYQTYKAGPCKAYTFSQKNTHYRNDSIIGHSEWHEAIEFPDKFRIDFGDKASGNFVIFKNDSSYRYKNAVLVKKTYDTNSLLLLLGGIYYRSLEEVMTRLQQEHYDTAILSKQKWRKQAVYVIGAQPGDTTTNQIWISKKTWQVVRIIEKMEEGHMMDMTFDAHQKHCKGYVETKVTFRDNGKIKQVEEYYDIKTVESFPADVFSPVQVQK